MVSTYANLFSESKEPLVTWCLLQKKTGVVFRIHIGLCKTPCLC